MFEITKTTSESDGYGGLIVSVVNSENEEIWNRFDSYNENIDCVCSVVSKDFKTVYFIDEENGFYAVDVSLKKDLDTKDLCVHLDFDNCGHIDSIGFDVKLIISENEKFAYILSEKQFFIIDIEYPKIVSQLEILDKESYEECDDMSLSSDEHNVIITTSDEKSVIINIEDVSNSKIVKGELKWKRQNITH